MDGLPGVVAGLRRGDGIAPDGFMADYLALGWLSWRDGCLHLTALGQRMCLSASAQAFRGVLV